MSSSLGQRSPSHGGWVALRLVLLIETIAGAALVVLTVPQFLAASADPLGARVSVMLAVVLSWLWVLVTLVGARKRAGWARGSALTLHVLLFAAGAGVMQGIFGHQPLIASTLLVLAVVGFFAAIVAKPDPHTGE